MKKTGKLAVKDGFATLDIKDGTSYYVDKDVDIALLVSGAKYAFELGSNVFTLRKAVSFDQVMTGEDGTSYPANEVIPVGTTLTRKPKAYALEIVDQKFDNQQQLFDVELEFHKKRMAKLDLLED